MSPNANVVSEFPNIKASFRRRMLELTSDQIREIAVLEPKLAKAVERDFDDTYERDWMVDVIVQKVLGPGTYWPINGDGLAASIRFYRDFFPAAKAAGYALVPEYEDEHTAA